MVAQFLTVLFCSGEHGGRHRQKLVRCFRPFESPYHVQKVILGKKCPIQVAWKWKHIAEKNIQEEPAILKKGCLEVSATKVGDGFYQDGVLDIAPVPIYSRSLNLSTPFMINSSISSQLPDEETHFSIKKVVRLMPVARWKNALRNSNRRQKLSSDNSNLEDPWGILLDRIDG